MARGGLYRHLCEVQTKLGFDQSDLTMARQRRQRQATAGGE